jgi:hypothetical protein
MRPNIPQSTFKSESYDHAISCALTYDIWNNPDIREVFRMHLEVDSKMGDVAVCDAVKSVLSESYTQDKISCNFVSYRSFVVHADRHLYVTCRNDHYRGSQGRINQYRMEVVGERKEVERLRERLRDQLHNNALVKVTWYYKSTDGINSSTMHVTGNPNQLRNEFYPWLRDGVNDFIDGYMKSNASILVMYGPPGTGKTSFLRHLLVQNNVNAIVTYDERVLSEDSFFVDYLTDETHDVLIVEDADVFLAPREGSANHMMSRFLNVSDGLIRMPHKKMIFTTNISQLGRIDQALLRPGRCYAAVEFRELSANEAAEAAAAAGLADRNWNKQDRWSLAELWGDSNNAELTAKPRFGFV